MKKKQVTFWMPESMSLLTLNFAEEYSEVEILKQIKAFRKEYLNLHGYDCNETIEEPECSALCKWIADHIYALEKYKINSVKELAISYFESEFANYLADSVDALENICSVLPDEEKYNGDVVAYIDALREAAIQTTPCYSCILEKIEEYKRHVFDSQDVESYPKKPTNPREYFLEEAKTMHELYLGEVRSSVNLARKHGCRAKTYKHTKL